MSKIMFQVIPFGFECIKAFTITIPPLRERKEDIPLLVRHFIEKFSKKYNFSKPEPDDEFIQVLMHRDYNGNIHELEGLVENIVVRFADCEKLTLEVLEGYNTDVSDSSIVTQTIPSIYSTENTDKPNFYLPSFNEIEASYYQELLIRTNGNQSKAAIIARLETRTFNNRLHSIKEKLKEESGKDFSDIPPLMELVKRFPPRNGKVG